MVTATQVEPTRVEPTQYEEHPFAQKAPTPEAATALARELWQARNRDRMQAAA